MKMLFLSVLFNLKITNPSNVVHQPALPLVYSFTRYCMVSLILCFSLNPRLSIASSLNLPDLGSSSGSIVSIHEENALGQQWLRAFRRQAPIEQDPQVYNYTRDLISRLAYFSQLKRKSFDLLLVDNESFNAFAVPGNVIGINTGLFRYADSEDELASVIAHELGHLSQRHYARTLERQKEDQWKNIAAILGGLLVMATAGGEEGVAAITAAQALAIGNRLKYSRLHEQEADRVGIETMANAGLNPSAAAYMFQKLLVNSRYRNDIAQFDFLFTHPLTESRVTDAFNQSRHYTLQDDIDSFHFHLMKNRLYVLNTHSRISTEHFKSEIRDAKFPNAARYGLALAYLKYKKSELARSIAESLYADSPHEEAYAILMINLLLAEKKYPEAVSMAQQHLALHPDSYPITMALAEVALKLRQPILATPSLYKVAKRLRSKTTPDVWYSLSELEGLAGNTIKIHTNRAEYYAGFGAYTEAVKHLKLAIPLLEKKKKLQELAKVQLRIKQFTQAMQRELF